MAPEQFREPESVSRRTDVWALGVILYELLTGRRPFAGDGPLSYARSVCESSPALPRSVRPRTDPELQAVCMKCLEKDPAQRYASAGELADELDRWRCGEIPLICPWRLPKRVYRAVRRRPAFASAVGFLVLAVVTVWAVSSYLADPERQQERVRSELAAGRDARLVGETGPPVTYAWDEGQDLAKVSTQQDRPFLVSTQATALVRLWSEPPPAFRFRAEVRHDRDARGGQVGVYINYKPSGPKLPRSCCYAVNFSDLSQNFKGSEDQNGCRTRLTFNWFRAGSKVGPEEADDLLLLGPMYVPPNQEVWRTVEVVVTPHIVTVARSNNYGAMECIGRMAPEEFDKFAAKLSMTQPEWKGFSFEATRRGAIGLYVRRSTASYRNVVLQPIDPES